jgi:large repetitive protein
VTASVTAGSGNVTNTATVAPPVGVSDPTPGNNAATDTDSVSSPALVADLAIVKTNAGSALAPGGSTVYVITVTNNGPAEVTNASVTDVAPAGLTLGSWTCAVTAPGSGGSVTTACGAANGFGNLNTTVTMKAGAVIAYTVQATVGATVSGSITNVATVSAPPGVLDPTPGNATSAVTVPVGQTATRPQPIPTLSTWGLLALSLLLAAGAIGARCSRLRERSSD